MQKVISKLIPGFERYLIYSDGRVYDSQEQKFCKQYNVSGYLIIPVHVNGKQKNLYVHRLVAQAFIPNPENKPEVDHKDTIRTNNTVYINDDGSVNEELSNLHWVTHKENHNNSLTKQHKSDVYTDERKQAASERMSGENNPMYGKEPWNKGKKCPQLSGENNPNYGKPKSDELRAKSVNKKYRNKLTGHITTSNWVNTWIKQGKTTQDEWDLVIE